MDDGEAIGSALDPGRPVIRGEDHRVPVTVWLVFEEGAGTAADFCRRHLDAEYAQLSVALTAKLARKRLSPLLRGDRRIWASAVIYALGRVNFLSDPSQIPHLPTERLAGLLGAKQTTMAAKGRVAMEALARTTSTPSSACPPGWRSTPPRDSSRSTGCCTTPAPFPADPGRARRPPTDPRRPHPLGADIARPGVDTPIDPSAGRPPPTCCAQDEAWARLPGVEVPDFRDLPRATQPRQGEDDSQPTWASTAAF